MIDCRSARCILRQAGGPARPTAEWVAAQQHLGHCRDCQGWQEAEREWREALQEKLPRISAPLSLRERLFAALAQARVGTDLRGQRRRWAAAVLALCLLTVALGSLWWWRERSRGGFLVAALAEDHLLYAGRPAPAEVASDDPVVVAQWLADRLDFAVPVPGLRGAGLLGGRLCTLADRRVALWLYQSGDRRVSLFQMPAEGLPLSSLRIMTADGQRFRCAHRKGVSVLAWTERDLLFVLVSDLPETDLIRLARS